MRGFFWRKAFTAAVLAGVLLRHDSASAQNAVLEGVVAKWNSLSSFKANITVSSENHKFGGILSYQQGRAHVEFSDGRIVASTGRVLTVYSPVSRVAAKQDLLPDGGGGLNWILSDQYEREIDQKSAKLKSSNPNLNIQEVRVSWDDSMILNKLSYRVKESETFTTIHISNLRTVEGFPSNLFSYKPPAGSRTVENPLHQRN